MNMEDSINERFKYFTEKIVPQFSGDNMDHTLIFVPNYLEYVKVRNWFKATDRDFCEISEYRYASIGRQVPQPTCCVGSWGTRLDLYLSNQFDVCNLPAKRTEWQRRGTSSTITRSTSCCTPSAHTSTRDTG